MKADMKAINVAFCIFGEARTKRKNKFAGKLVCSTCILLDLWSTE